MTIKNFSDKLKTSYSNLTGRYSVLDNSSSSQKNSLEVLIARVDDDISMCATDREDAREVLNQLTIELRDKDRKNTIDDMKHATLFLLGGLIHRLYRIEAAYNTTNELIKYTPYTFFFKRPSAADSRLYVAIRKALRLDKRPLDEVTIITSLQVFRKDMLKRVSIKKANSEELIKIKRYKTYPHLFKDVNFLNNLDTMLKEHSESEKGVYGMHQVRAIDFMETLANQLDESRKGIREWSQNLSKAYKDFKQLNEQLILNHLNSYIKEKIDSILILISKANEEAKEFKRKAREEADEEAREDAREDADEKAREVRELEKKIALLRSIKKQTKGLLFNIVLDNLESYPKLVEQMFQDNAQNNLCILCGGYTLLVHKGNKVDKRLLMQMNKALGLETELNAEEERSCIQRLLLYVDKAAPLLDCEFFNGMDNMVTSVTQLSLNLELAKKQRETQEKSVENIEGDTSSHLIISKV